jgi:iron complex outermembrane receptor protein
MRRSPVATAIHSALALALASAAAHAQTAGEPAQKCQPGQPGCEQEVVVTGSRIATISGQAEQPISVISQEAIEKTGLASVGDLLQQLTTGGKALNTKFNPSGNFGYPPDGGGIGAGSTQIDLRSLDSKRALVLVDGIRWVNESSASGVSGSADLNTIPISIVDHIEVLEDGASAIYGSDAIAGVINIITRKRVDGVEVSGYGAGYSKGGRTSEASFTAGGSSDKFSAMFVVSYFNQDAISSGKWGQSSFPEPIAGLLAGSSGTPQGRFIFCDPTAPITVPQSCAAKGDYSVTLNNGTATPTWSPNNPATNTYHHFTNADRFNFAPFNLLSTPSERKAIFTNLTYNITDDVDLHFKGLFNNRQSTNQAAPEPIFVGPGAGTAGIADTISVAANNPFNPFGYALDANTNFVLLGRRPVEVGPRIFTQDVNTYYFTAGFKGTLRIGNGFTWDISYANSDNKATQAFVNGYNVAKLKIALGDVNVCNATPGCVPLDLFGGQGRQMTPAMINYIRAAQNDSSDQKLQLFSANLTGEMFKIDGRPAGFAIGAEHRKYDGAFNPDPLRQTGESQDSPAFPVSASYHVNEAYAEFRFPLLASLSTSAAVRYSDYSTFGGDTTGKVGFRWQPLNDFAIRGTYSKGFRAPNLGELYGLTQFAPTLVDPCGPTGGPVNPLPAGCVAQGVRPGFQQANSQITVFTGGNPNLKPEKSDSYTGGVQYLASWAESAVTDRLGFEATYYHHKITGGIQAADMQALLNTCIAQGGVGGPICAPFSRQSNGNLNPPRNLLQNFGDIQTGGIDAKVDWFGKRYAWGRLTASLQATDVTQYRAVDTLGIVSQRQVGIEVVDSAIPKLRANAQLGWNTGNWTASWILRYLDSVKEACANAVITAVPGCSNGETFHSLASVLYNDAQVEWNDAFTLKGFKIDLGVNNIFGKEPPICYTCTLNGYDAGTYDLPGAFWNVRAMYKF